MAKSRSRVTIEIENLDEVLAELRPAKMARDFEKMYKDLGADVHKVLQQKMSTSFTNRSGTLAGSFKPIKIWNYTHLPFGGAIISDVFYGRFLDQGFYTKKGLRFLKKTGTASRGDAARQLDLLKRRIESSWGMIRG